MPEGDVVASWAKAIDVALAGKPIVYASSTRVRLSTVVGKAIIQARAHGKQLLVEFDDGRLLRTHLRMHGSIRVRPGSLRELPMNPHVRWLIAVEDRTALCLDAPTIELLRSNEVEHHPVLSRLGPDVLAPTLELDEIVARLRRQPERPIGSAVMDQEILAGIGNIYKSETLFLTRVSPFVPVGELPDDTLVRVVQEARRLMRRNLGPDRRTTPAGRIASKYWVYERSGQPCLRCGERIRMQRQEPLARSTYYCPDCQRAPDKP